MLPVVHNPGGEVVLGSPVIAQPAYADQKVPPHVLFGQPAAAGSPFFYSQPQGFAASPHAQAMPATGATQVAAIEVTADFTNGDLRNTATPRYAGDARAVTHANFFWNDISRLDGLARFPNLIRLTLRGNKLSTLVGLDACPFLRWLDVSTNDLRDFTGAAQIRSLEWLDAHNNNLRSLDGLGFAPNLTWLNVCNSDITSLQGLSNLPNLRALDASRNELGTTSGVCSCPHLIELSVSVNNLTDLTHVSELRELRALDASSNCLDHLPSFSACAQLHTLEIANNDLGSRNVEEVLAAFSGHPSLRLLVIGRNSFTHDDCQRLKLALERNGCLVDASNAVPPGENDGSDSRRSDCAPAACVIA